MSREPSSIPSSSKRKKMATKEQYSDRFLSLSCARAYILFSKTKITESKVILQSSLDFPILDLFRSTSLFFLVTLQFTYHPEMLLEFLANFSLNVEGDTMRSYVCKKRVEFSEADLCRFLHLSSDSENRAHELAANSGFRWLEVNRVLRDHDSIFHIPKTESLNTEAKVVQHVLRNAVLPKAGDRKNITPLLSLVTYYVRTNTDFNSANLIIRYFHSLQKIAEPTTKKKYNIGLGHVVAYLLFHKYQLTYPGEATHSSIPFSNHSFHIFYPRERPQSSRSHHMEQEEEEEEEHREDQGQAGPSTRFPLVARFDRLESSVNQLSEQSQALYNQALGWHDEAVGWHNEDIAWRAEQNQRLDQLSLQMGQLFEVSHPPPPPPSDDPSYF